jgi:hypothetical protein
MWGNPMREREIYYSASGNYILAAKKHFQPRKTPHSTKSVPQKSASFFVPKSYRCLASSVPRFSCHSPLYGLFHMAQNNHRKSKNRLKNCAKNHLDFRAKSVRMYIIVWIVQTIRVRTVRPPIVEKYFGQKFTEIFSQESCPRSSKNVPSLLLTFLSQAYSKNLSNSPPDVLS